MSAYRQNEHHLTLSERMQILSAGTKYDSCNQSAVCHAFGPDGRCIQLYKTLLSNSCAGECAYCPNRCERETKRASLEPAEIAKITWPFRRRGPILERSIRHRVKAHKIRPSQCRVYFAEAIRGGGTVARSGF